MKKKTLKKLNKKIIKQLLPILAQESNSQSNPKKIKSKIIKVKQKSKKRVSLWVKLDCDLVAQKIHHKSDEYDVYEHDIIENFEENVDLEKMDAGEMETQPETQIDPIPTPEPIQTETQEPENHTETQLALSRLQEENDTLHNLLHEQDEEIKSLKSKLQDLNHLTYQQENAMKNKRMLQEATLLQYGQEHNLYDDEILSFVRQSLEYSLKNQTHTNSRYQHILEDVLQANPLPCDTRAEKIKALQQAMRTYERMDNSTRQALHKMGFTLTEEGAHFKLIFMGDGRYTCTTSKTSSDVRAGKNFVRDVSNLLF